MPTSFIIFISAFVVLLVTSFSTGRTTNPRAKSALNGAGGAAILVIFAVILWLMWQAWSPWDINLESR